MFNTSFSFSEPLFLPPDQIAQVTPIVREAIINAQRHSGASQIQIRGTQLDGQIRITVEDNGKGFDLDKKTNLEGAHFGLKVMRARAARFGGKLKIVSNPDNGTIITLSWMLNRKREEKKDDLSQHKVRQKSPTIESEPYV